MNSFNINKMRIDIELEFNDQNNVNGLTKAQASVSVDTDEKSKNLGADCDYNKKINAIAIENLLNNKSSVQSFISEIIARTPQALAHIPEAWKADKEIIGSLINAFVFGKEKWEKFIGSVGSVPPLPDDIVDILFADDLFDRDFPRKKVIESHMLVYVPTTVGGVELNLNFLQKLTSIPKDTNSTKLINNVWTDISEKFGATPPPNARWILMRKEIISDIGINASTQLIKNVPHYEFPDMLSVTVAIIAHYMSTQERLFSNSFTFCKELALSNYKEKNVAIGCFSQEGFHISFGSYANAFKGVAALRNLSTDVAKV